MKFFFHRLKRVLLYYTQFYTNKIKFINNSFSRKLVLTFDDGPHPVLTRQVLGVLKQYDIFATFFLSGHAIEKSPDLANEIFKEGHLLGNHGYDHISSEKLSSQQLISGFEKTNNLIKKITGEKNVAFCRPPYGKASKSYLKWINKGNRYTVGWSLDSYDYRNELNIDQIAEMLLRDVQNGDILLFHDTKPLTPDVLGKIIPVLLSRKYSFIRLDKKFL